MQSSNAKKGNPMRKPAELRDYLTRAHAFLAANPEKLRTLLGEGRVIATGHPSYSHEYRYVLNLVVEGYEGATVAIMLPLLAWLRANQPELFENPAKRDAALAFTVEFVSDDTMDLSIKLPLTERIIANVDPNTGQIHARHAGEPPDPSLPVDAAETVRDVYMDGMQIAKLPYAGWTPSV